MRNRLIMLLAFPMDDLSEAMIYDRCCRKICGSFGIQDAPASGLIDARLRVSEHDLEALLITS
jgi:hypothetical protein